MEGRPSRFRSPVPGLVAEVEAVAERVRELRGAQRAVGVQVVVRGVGRGSGRLQQDELQAGAGEQERGRPDELGQVHLEPARRRGALPVGRRVDEVDALVEGRSGGQADGAARLQDAAGKGAGCRCEDGEAGGSGSCASHAIPLDRHEAVMICATSSNAEW